MNKFYNLYRWFATFFLIFLSLCYSSAANYLCFTAKEAGSVLYYTPSNEDHTPKVFYSFNEKDWYELPSSTNITMANIDDKVYLKGNNPNGFSFSKDDFTRLSTKGQFEVSGNVMSLIDGDGESTEIPNDYCFYRLFDGCSIVSAPELPATTLKPNCYNQMFWGCPIEKAPELPATKLAKSCYAGMMGMCTYLEETPDLPATELADSCYSGMFTLCSNLKKVANLPAKKLKEGCYNEMFQMCSSLKYIKVGCSSLDYNDSQGATLNWFGYVEGTDDCVFIFPCGSTYDKHGYSEVPTGFTIINSPVVVFKNPDGTVLKTDIIECGTAPYYGEEPPFLDNEHEFVKWDKDLKVLDEPDIYYYTAEYKDADAPAPGKWLCFTAEKAGSVLSYRSTGDDKPNVFYSFNGLKWYPLLEGESITLAEVGHKVYIKGNNTNGFSFNDDNYTTFLMKGQIAASGSVMSLIDGEGTTTKIPNANCFRCLFKDCSALTQAPELPATQLTSSCYSLMFSGCSSLTEAPELPATELASSCYYYMFNGCVGMKEAPELPATKLASACYFCMFIQCESFTKAPELPAKNLAAHCYQGMFQECTNLKEAPALPAKQMEKNCYTDMFHGCKSLVEAPVLPAENLADGCYHSMFLDCTSLTEAPKLPALELYEKCYRNMFSGCTSLAKAPELPATTLETACYQNMFLGCSKLNYIKVGVMTLDNDVEATENWVGGIGNEGLFIFPCGSKYNKRGESEVPKYFTIQASPIIIFQNPDKKELYRDTISCDTAPKYYGEFPPKYKDGLVFKGWDVEPHVHETPDIYYYTAVYGEEEDIDLDKILCFTAVESNSTISYNCMGNKCPDLQVSLDSGKTWESMANLIKVDLENIGDKVYFRGDNPNGFHNTENDFLHFTMIGKFAANGSVMSLLDMKGELTEIPCDYCFYNLFRNCPLTQAPDLPATELTKGCYKEMFKGCYYLQKAPELPAETVKEESYEAMFNGCSSLSEMPKLPATTLGKRCYSEMFVGCINLTKAYDLPAKKMETSCYAYMFTACSKLKEAPALPATELADSCYCFMFLSCENLTTAPELPATTLKTSCYDHMFTNCQNLETVPDLKATVVAENCCNGMFIGCTYLRKAPALPAETLERNCYYTMFAACVNLKEAPELPATTLAEGCYNSMFGGCMNLGKAPELPATILAEGCYGNMFAGCTNLIKAPELPATKLTNGCYSSMFTGCASLNYIKVGLMTLDNEFNATDSWVGGVVGPGVFIFPCGSKYDKHGISEVPDNFKIISSPIVIFQNPDSTVLYRDTIDCGDWPSYERCVTCKPPYYGDSLVFINWDKELEILKDPDIYYYTAIYEKKGEKPNLDKILCFTAEEAGSTISYINTIENPEQIDVQYSIDEGESWHKIDPYEKVTLEKAGDKVYFKGNNPNGLNIDQEGNIFNFEMEGKIAASGSIMSLIDGVGETTVIPCNHCFEMLFLGCDALTQAPELTATVLTESCYHRMFDGCTSLTKAPELPAKDLARYCYILMFDECTSLTQAPELPATKLADGCYMGMFDGCTSLTQAPELPAAELTEDCYSYMFARCTSLINVPELPATNLTVGCYDGMFAGCSSLTNAPELPATKLAAGCYSGMFAGCSSLAKAPELPAKELVYSCYKNMFSECKNLNYIKVGVMTLDNELIATENWVKDVDGTGTFIFPCGSKYNKHGISEVPDKFEIISSPIVIFQNPDSTVLYRDTISCDTAPVYYGVFPPVYKDGDVFVGWDVEPHVHETPGTYYYTAVYEEDTTSTQNNWLCFTAEEAGSKVWYDNVDNNPDVQYSLDEGKTWQTLEEGSKVTLKDIGDKVYFKGNNPKGFSHGENAYSKFFMTRNLKASGSVMSLIDGKGTSKEIPSDYCFNLLFNNCISLTEVPELPATKLTKGCYYGMFGGCTHITKAPKLPATEMKESCYDGMFYDCTSLETPPALPAMKLADNCYSFMFTTCTGMKEAPELPATEMATGCYSNMFGGCNFETPPALPAKKLAEGCYESMFISCKIKKAPDLPATEMANGCYFNMFGICTLLETPPALPATKLAERCYSNMFQRCTNLKTAPELPAKELAPMCYAYMFNKCVSIERAPELPATTLADECYAEMFMDCSSLTKAPELPAKELVNYCYKEMFSGCSNLNYIKVGVMTLDNEFGATRNWVSGVDGPGTFIFPCGTTYDKHGYSEVPLLFEIKGYESTTDSIITGCDSIVYDGITYYDTKEWNDTISTVDGCDSIIAYHLIVHKSTVKEETIYAEESFIWHDMVYTESTSWDDSLTSVFGCDSVIRYNLIIKEEEKSKLNLDVKDDDMILILPGDEQPISYILTGGKGSHYEIRNKNKLVCSGEVANDSSVNLICPNNMEPGSHTFTMEMCDDEGNCAKDEFEINVMMPDDKEKSYYVKVWNDVVICRNGDGKFVSYQWYKNGKKIDDASLQYFNDISLLDGEYMVFVSDKDGKSYFIEPINYEAMMASYGISAIPSVVDRGSEFTVTVTGVTGNNMSNARIVVYGTNGVVERIINEIETSTTMRLPSGEYIIVLTVNDGKNANCKVLVK